jgi:tetratricopeptide (TPR) repeat protein
MGMQTGTLISAAAVLAAVLLSGAAAIRGTVSFILGVRAASRGSSERSLRWMLRAARAPLGLRQGCIASVTLLKNSRIEEAEQLFSRLSRKNLAENNRSQLESYRALLLWQQGKREEAAELLETLLRSGFRTTHLYSSLGYFVLHIDRDAEYALSVNLEAVDYDETPDSLDNLGAAYLAVGDWEKADEVLDKALAGEPGFAEAWYHGAQAALRRGDRERALSRFRRALESAFSPLSVLDRTEVQKQVDALETAATASEEK